MNFHFERDFQIAASQDNDRVARITKQMCGLERFQVYIRIGFERLGQLIKIDFVIRYLIGGVKPSPRMNGNRR